MNKKRISHSPPTVFIFKLTFARYDNAYPEIIPYATSKNLQDGAPDDRLDFSG